MTLDDDMREAIEQRLAARLETNRARRDGRARRLAELATRRQVGLRARHHNKLNRDTRGEAHMTTPNGRSTATVETLAAEVHVLKVGSRQITMSVFNQLDSVRSDEIEPFGRVRTKDSFWGAIDVVGRSLRPQDAGALVSASHPSPQAIEHAKQAAAGERPSWDKATDEERAARELRAGEWAALPLIVLAGLR